MTHKFLYCKNCNKETWCDHHVGLYYLCSNCKKDVWLVDHKKWKENHKKEVKKAVKDRNFSKPSREIDKDYVSWIHGWGCVICGKSPVEAHHLDRRSQLGSDRNVLPFCREHHSELHTKGILSFKKAHPYNLEEFVELFNRLYDSGKKGPYDHLRK